MIKLGQKWPGDLFDNTFWIGVDPMNSSVQHEDGLVLVGRECRSYAELEMLASEIRSELDAVLNEARIRLRKSEPSPFEGGGGFQTRVVPMRSGR